LGLHVHLSLPADRKNAPICSHAQHAFLLHQPFHQQNATPGELFEGSQG
jgi:hypothetical protein